MLNLFARDIELHIDTKKGEISSLKLRGKERIACACPLFVVRLRDINGEKYYLRSADAKNVDTCNGCITYIGFENFDSVIVKLFVSANIGIDWSASVLNVPKDFAIEWIELPKICLPRLIENNPSGGKIVFPYDEGILLTNDSLLPRYEPEFPSSGAYFTFPNKVCSQFIAYLFDDVGLYIGAHDKKRGLKGIDFYPYETGLAMQIRAYSGVDYGSDFNMDYKISWQVCPADWKSATDIYREWFYNNVPENLTPTCQNKALPKWYEGSPLVVTYPVRGIHDMDKMEPNALFPFTNALPILNKIKQDTGCQIMALLMHWEGTAPWAPPYVWPPYGGVDGFNKFKNALHESGDLLGVYCSGFGYTLRSTLIEEYNCEEKIKNEDVLSGVCHSPQNKPELGITCTPYQRYGYDICPASRRGREILEEGYTPVLESGVDYAQILDQNHGGGQYMCFAREHNHPPMPGGWMTSNLTSLLKDWQSKAPNMLFGCESAAAEPFIGGLLFSDNRFELNYPFGTPVPVYAYIYHEYVRNFMGNQCGCPFEPKWDTLRYRLAYSFSIGDVMTVTLAPNGELMTHWGTHDFESSPNMELTMKFIGNMRNFYNEKGKKYLYCGKMRPCPDIECDTIDIPLFRGRKIATLPKLLSSTWWDGDNTAYIVVNPENNPVDFKIGEENYTVAPLDAMLIIK